MFRRKITGRHPNSIPLRVHYTLLFLALTNHLHTESVADLVVSSYIGTSVLEEGLYDREIGLVGNELGRESCEGL